MLIEVCVADVESAVAAARGGAHRVELCADLPSGGTTPSAGAIELARERLDIPVHVLIRPRPGGFVYSETELATIERDIEAAKDAGVHGVVIGVLDASGRVDASVMRDLVATARPLSVTFHRAIDQASDVDRAYAELANLGVDRVLTSGGARTATEGRVALERLAQLADRGGPTVLVGGGLDVDACEAFARLGFREAHVGSCVASVVDSNGGGSEANAAALGPGGRAATSLRHRVDSALVAELVGRVASVGGGSA